VESSQVLLHLPIDISAFATLHEQSYDFVQIDVELLQASESVFGLVVGGGIELLLLDAFFLYVSQALVEIFLGTQYGELAIKCQRLL